MDRFELIWFKTKCQILNYPNLLMGVEVWQIWGVNFFYLFFAKFTWLFGRKKNETQNLCYCLRLERGENWRIIFLLPIYSWKLRKLTCVVVRKKGESLSQVKISFASSISPHLFFFLKLSKWVMSLIMTKTLPLSWIFSLPLLIYLVVPKHIYWK